MLLFFDILIFDSASFTRKTLPLLSGQQRLVYVRRIFNLKMNLHSDNHVTNVTFAFAEPDASIGPQCVSIIVTCTNTSATTGRSQVKYVNEHV